MNIKPTELQIDKINPFLGDRIRRRPSIETLTTLVSTFTEPFVLCIDSPWGTGKTTFVKMWKQYLENEEFYTLYFNAWENDFSKDPLIALISEIDSSLKNIETDDGETKTKAKELLDKAKKTSIVAFKRLLPLAIKMASQGILDLKSEDIEGNLADFMGKVAEDGLKHYEEAKNSIKAFKDRLAEFSQTITGSGKSYKPLVFFIDELDRCRPTFAIELIENAKHLFNVEGIVFVLALDKEQLGHSISSVFGGGMDTDGYLRRFIDLSYRLQLPENYNFGVNLLEKNGINKYLESVGKDAGDLDWFMKLLNQFSIIFNFSLRKQEQCISELAVLIRLNEYDFWRYNDEVSAFVLFRAAMPKLYELFIEGNCEVQTVIDYINNSEPGNTFLSKHAGRLFESILIILKYRDLNFINETIRRPAEYSKIYENPQTPLSERKRIDELFSFFEKVYYDLYKHVRLSEIKHIIEILGRFH